MAIPTAALTHVGAFQGLCFEVDKFSFILSETRNRMFLARKDVEQDANYKQLIPYVVLSHENSVFSYRRGKLAREKRLMGKYSIGVGGHVSVRDPTLFWTDYEEGLRREMNEEIEIRSKYEMKMVALLNDDSDKVGKFHLGIVYIAQLESPLVVAKEKSICEAKFLSIPDLRKNIDKYESWSRICICEIERLLRLCNTKISSV